MLILSYNRVCVCVCVHVCVCMCVSCSVLFNTLQPHGLGVHQAPLSMEFSRQEYWSGLPFPSPGDLSDPGLEPGSSTLKADYLLSEPLGNSSLTTNSGLGQWDNSKWITHRDFEHVYRCACLSCCFWNTLLPCK